MCNSIKSKTGVSIAEQMRKRKSAVRKWHKKKIHWSGALDEKSHTNTQMNAIWTRVKWDQLHFY